MIPDIIKPHITLDKFNEAELNKIISQTEKTDKLANSWARCIRAFWKKDLNTFASLLIESFPDVDFSIFLADRYILLGAITIVEIQVFGEFKMTPKSTELAQKFGILKQRQNYSQFDAFKISLSKIESCWHHFQDPRMTLTNEQKQDLSVYIATLRQKINKLTYPDMQPQPVIQSNTIPAPPASQVQPQEQQTQVEKLPKLVLKLQVPQSQAVDRPSVGAQPANPKPALAKKRKRIEYEEELWEQIEDLEKALSKKEKRIEELENKLNSKEKKIAKLESELKMERNESNEERADNIVIRSNFANFFKAVKHEASENPTLGMDVENKIREVELTYGFGQYND